jgi:hypothetical protein
VGELVQLDGSHHEWLEGRGPRCVLMAYIDDASSRVYARFYEYEGTVPALDSFSRYVKQHGIPLAVYTDKHTIYKSPAEPTVDEQLEGCTPQSQFERSLAEIGVKVIHAHSPQAKGRVERLFAAFQDRLVKERRLARICDPRGRESISGRLSAKLQPAVCGSARRSSVAQTAPA